MSGLFQLYCLAQWCPRLQWDFTDPTGPNTNVAGMGRIYSDVVSIIIRRCNFTCENMRGCLLLSLTLCVHSPSSSKPYEHFPGNHIHPSMVLLVTLILFTCYVTLETNISSPNSNTTSFTFSSMFWLIETRHGPWCSIHFLHCASSQVMNMAY